MALLLVLLSAVHITLSSAQCIDVCGAGAQGDPHLMLPSGGRADFRGEHGALYNFLSAKDLSLNVMTELADFELHLANSSQHKLVHGSFLTQAHIVARASTGKVVRVSFWADKIGAGNLGWANGTIDSEPVFKLSFAGIKEKQIDDVALKMDYSSLHVFTPEFEIVILAHHFDLERNVIGLHHRLDVQINPRVAENAFALPPHGIIGQGWDGDGMAIDGETDAWPKSGEFTTYAMARGAIEGVPNDYKVAKPYATEFKYSRFDATSASVRNVPKLVTAGWLNKPRMVQGGDLAVGATEKTEYYGEEMAARRQLQACVCSFGEGPLVTFDGPNEFQKISTTDTISSGTPGEVRVTYRMNSWKAYKRTTQTGRGFSAKCDPGGYMFVGLAHPSFPYWDTDSWDTALSTPYAKIRYGIYMRGGEARPVWGGGGEKMPEAGYPQNTGAETWMVKLVGTEAKYYKDGVVFHTEPLSASWSDPEEDATWDYYLIFNHVNTNSPKGCTDFHWEP
uniref:Uncharacterized protein n=1 Tax=Haptolina brevifila TaxID=156173 RepID=A0A7S2NB72_9EUKA|mmetsp:Transcript_71904/g.142540  ORF Transcript_71904/g.142540 Transcript_71904/m.142540 type:complete len:507 (+) Transcript_71904:86-1606(+)